MQDVCCPESCRNVYHVARIHVAMCESCHMTHIHTYTHAHTLHIAIYHVARNHVAMCESCHMTHIHTYTHIRTRTHAHTLHVAMHHVAMDHVAMCKACHMTEACLLCKIMSHTAPSYAALCIPRPLMNKRHDNTEICVGNVSRMRVSHVT